MVETPLIRHGFAVPPSPLWGEGSRYTQIGWNCSHCGTFEYIYWELGRSAPVGGRAAQGHPYGSYPRAAGASPRPTSVHSIDFFGILSPYPLSFAGG